MTIRQIQMMREFRSLIDEGILEAKGIDSVSNQILYGFTEQGEKLADEAFPEDDDDTGV